MQRKVGDRYMNSHYFNFYKRLSIFLLSPARDFGPANEVLFPEDLVVWTDMLSEIILLTLINSHSMQTLSPPPAGKLLLRCLQENAQANSFWQPVTIEVEIYLGN